MSNPAYVAITGLFAAALIGCNKPGLPPTVKLEGAVTLDGKPLSNALISFHPADKDGASPVFEQVVKGRYSAAVVPQGKYRVAFRSTSAPEGYGQPNAPVDSGFAAPKQGKQKSNTIPEKYQEPTFLIDVTADNSSLNFELKSNR